MEQQILFLVNVLQTQKPAKIGEILNLNMHSLRTLSFSLCTNGCLECRPSTQECSTCIWSDWSPFGVCSDPCNGTQTRYRSRSCTNTASPEFQYENRTCSTNETSYRKGCAQCSCNSLTGEETCHVQCAITPEICANITSDPFSIYEYIPPPDGQCCGSCNRTDSMFNYSSSSSSSFQFCSLIRN